MAELVECTATKVGGNGDCLCYQAGVEDILTIIDDLQEIEWADTGWVPKAKLLRQIKALP